MQAKLTAIDDTEDDSSNGLGVVQSRMVLYNVNEPAKEKVAGKKRVKEKLRQEPRDRDYIRFYLN